MFQVLRTGLDGRLPLRRGRNDLDIFIRSLNSYLEKSAAGNWLIGILSFLYHAPKRFKRELIFIRSHHNPDMAGTITTLSVGRGGVDAECSGPTPSDYGQTTAHQAANKYTRSLWNHAIYSRAG